MSFLIPTNAVQIARFANGLYGVQLGFASTNGITSDVSTGGLLATFNNYYSLSFGSQTTASVAQQIVTNLGIVAGTNGQTASSVSVALAYVTGQLNAAAPAARGAAVKAVLDLWSSISADPVNGATYGAAATAWNGTISGAVQYAGAVNPDITVGAAVAVNAANALIGKTFTLSAGIDNFSGSAANDTFNATQATFTGLDSIVGGGGSDILTITATGAYTTPTGVTVSGVGTVSISGTAALTVDTSSGFTGVTNLTASNTAGTSSVKSAPGATVLVTNSAPGSSSTTVDGGKDVTVSVSGSTAAADTITVGGTTAPTGNTTVNLSSSLASTAAANATGSTITVKGGSTINVTSTVSNTFSTMNVADTANFATLAGAIAITGTAGTTAVTVTQSAPIGQVTARAAANNVSSLTTGVVGVTAQTVDISDANANTTSAGSIATVTLKNYGATTIKSNALTTLNLTQEGTGILSGSANAGGNITITDSLPVPTATTLTINMNGGSTGIISGNNYSTININLTKSGTIKQITDTGLKTLNLTGTGVVTMTQFASGAAGNAGTVVTAIPATITSITTAGASGLNANISNTAVTAYDASASSGAQTLILSSTQTFKGGAGADNIRIDSDALGAITAGSAATNTLTLGPVAATLFTTNSFNNVKGFNTLVTSALGLNDTKNQTTGTIDLSKWVNNTFTAISYSGYGSVATATNFTNVTLGTTLTINGVKDYGFWAGGTSTNSAGTVGYNLSDFNGFNDSVNVTLKGVSAGTVGNDALSTNTFTRSLGTMGYTTTQLTLLDAGGTGISTVNLTSDASVNGGTHTITTLVDPNLSTLNISGTGALTIGKLVATTPTLTINDTDTSITAAGGQTGSGITVFDDASISNISYTGTQNFVINVVSAAATPRIITSASFTASNVNTGTSGVLTLGFNNANVTTINSAKTINLKGAIAGNFVSSFNTDVQTVNGSTDHANVVITLNGGTVDTVTLGNGSNTVVTGAAADVITLGTGTNSVTPKAGGDAVTFAAGHSGVDTLFYVAVGDTFSGTVSNGATVLNTATGADIINGMKAGDKINLSALGTFTAANLAGGILTTFITAGTNGDVGLIRGNYNSTTGYFTTSATGVDTLLQFDSDGTTNAAAINSAVLVGFVNSASASAAGVITLG